MGLESIYRLSLIMNMVDQLTGPMAGVQSSVSSTVSGLQGLQMSFGDMTKTGAAMAGVGAQITESVLAPVKATFDTKRALGELASMGVKDFDVLETAALNFSNTWAGTSKADFLSAAVDIKGGIDSLTDEGVAGYTKLSGITAKATGSTIGEMTSLFATGYGIYKDYYNSLSDFEFGEMFSAGLAQAILTFKASGSSMAQSITSLGGAATTANVPMEEQLAILGMLQATMSGSESGTKYRAFLRTAAKAGDELGLSFLDVNNQLLSMPEILETLKSKFGDTVDAVEKLEIQKAFGSDEAVGLIDLLYTKTGDLQNNILTLYSSMGEGVAVTERMANAINSTDPDKYVVLEQKLQNLKEAVGNTLNISGFMDQIGAYMDKAAVWIGENQELVSVLMTVALAVGGFLTVAGTGIAVIGGIGLAMTKASGMFLGFGRALLKVPDLILNIRIMALYAGDGIKFAFGGIAKYGGIAVSGVKNVSLAVASMARTAAVSGAGAMKSFVLALAGMARQAVITAAQALPGLIASVWGFTAALLANPITWIVIGIIALVAAIILLWQNWDSVTAWLKGAWNSFTTTVSAGFQKLIGWFSGLPGWVQIALAAFLPFIGIPLLIITNWDSIKEYFVGVWDSIKATFTAAIDFVKALFSGDWAWIRESGAKLIRTFADGIRSALSAPIEAVKGGLAKIREMLPFSDAKTGPLSELTLSGRKVLDTVTTGIKQTAGHPAAAVENAFSRIDMNLPDNVIPFPQTQYAQRAAIPQNAIPFPLLSEPRSADVPDAPSLPQQPVNKVNVKEIFRESKETSSTVTEKGGGVHIGQVTFQLDIKDIEDLKKAIKLMKEFEEYQNSNSISSDEESA